MALPRSFAALLFAAALAVPPAGFARQEDPPAAPSLQEGPEVAKERQTAERFLTLLERNPRPGTALDRAYAFFAERGELAALADRLRARAAADPADAAAPAVLGLIESRRGNDEEAVAAFEAAADRAPDDPDPRARLAEAYVLAGRPGQAAEAYEAALARDPARRDLPELLSGLGRVLTRGGKAEEADAVWDRLIEKFPGDDAVREQIAAVLEAEGDLDGALARYEALAKETTDEYGRVTHALKAASLKVRTGRVDDAVRDFEALLADLNPDSWLFREVRGGIERAFLRTDDLAGLTSYYEGWIAKHPEDVAAMARLGELLDRQSRTAEAREWFGKAVAKAPSDGRLRRALVDQLLRAGEYDAAAEQFAELNRLAPGDADTLRDWGTVFLDDPSLPADQRLAKAEAVWRKLLDGRADDPVAVTQVADWLRQAGAEGPAKTLYAKAVELAPDDPRYREYLGEYLHVLGESEEAVTVWEGLAAGANRGVRTLARLSEVLGGFGYDEQAAAAATEADALDVKQAGSPDPAAGELEFADRMRFAELFTRAERSADAEAQVKKAEALAVTPEERRAALGAAIAADAAAGKLAERTEALVAQAAAAPADAAVRLRLALYRDAAGAAVPAAEAAADAVRLAPTDVTALATLSELEEKAGRTAAAAATARRLADLDRKRRAEHLTRVAELQLRLGQRAEALRTAREVVAGAPGNAEGLAFLARVAFRVGEEEAGLDALRRAARTAGNDPGPLLELAGALADRFRTDEAVELLWRAFETADGFDDKALVVRRLTELARRQDRFEPFLEKLERAAAGRRRPGQAGEGPDREAALLLAEAHLAADDAASARGTLEPLLTRDPRDTTLLARLATLAETAGEADDAIDFQRRVVDLSAEPAERMRLAGMLARGGDPEAAERFYLELLGSTTDPVERVRAIDTLLKAGREGLAFKLADAGLARDGDDWELLTRLALAAVAADDDEIAEPPTAVAFTVSETVSEGDDGEAVGLGDGDEGQEEDEVVGLGKAVREAIAGAALRRVWEADLPDDTPSAAQKAADERRRSRRAGSGGRTASQTAAAAMPASVLRNRAVFPALMTLGLLDQEEYGYSFGSPVGSAGRATFEPEDYGAARTLAAAWLAAREEGFAEAVLAAAGVLLPEADAAEADAAEADEPAADADPNGDGPPLFAADASPTPRALWDAYGLAGIAPRIGALPEAVKTRSDDLQRGLTGRLARLPGAGTDEAMVYLMTLRSRQYVRPDQAEQPDPLTDDELTLVAESVEKLRASDLPSGMYSSGMYETVLLAELERADRDAEADALAERIVAEATEPDEIQTAASLLGSTGRLDAVLTLLNRAAALPPDQRAKALPNAAALVQVAADRTARGDLAGAFAALDAQADAAAEAAADVPPGRDATAARSIRTYIPRGGRGYSSRSEEGFPPAAAPIDDAQVSLLRTQLVWLRTPSTLSPVRAELAAEGVEAEPAPLNSDDPAAPLLEHLEARASRPDAAHPVHDLLRLASVRAWTGDVDGAMQALETALEKDPGGAALRRVVAAARIERGDAAGGLALLDETEPRDPDDLRDRELLALSTAARTGDLDRARAAAERLFGLRLGNAEQLELARAMQRLGLRDRAAAVLARMRRGAANDAAALAGIMDLQRREGNDEVAAEIARSVLAKFRPQTVRPGYGMTSAQAAANAARDRAVRVLKEVGGLDPILADLRDKLDRNPTAAPVREELMALLTAAGRTEELEALTAAMAEAEAPAARDAGALMTAAGRLANSGDRGGAADLYLKVIAVEPARIANDYWEVRQAFEQSKRGDELMAAIGATDPADWGRNRYGLTNLLSNAVNDSDTEQAALAAFQSLWENHPEARPTLFGSVHEEKLMAVEGVYEYALDELLGKSGRPGWDELGNVRLWSREPKGLTSLVLAAAKERGSLDEFAARIAAEREKHPDWQPGRALLAAAHAAEGDAAAARAEVEALLALPEGERPSGLAAWLLSVQLDPAEELGDLSLTLMRRAVASNPNTPYSGNGFEYSPQRRLVDLLVKQDANAEARDLLLAAVFRPELDDNQSQFRSSNAQYAARQDVESWTGIGEKLAEIGFPMAALRVLNHAVTDALPRSGMSGNSNHYYVRQLTEAVNETRGKLTPASVAADLRARLDADRAALEAGEELDSEPVLDLFVTATDGGEKLEDAAISAALVAALVAVPEVKENDRGNRLGAAAPPTPPAAATPAPPKPATVARGVLQSIGSALARLLGGTPAPQPPAVVPRGVVLGPGVMMVEEMEEVAEEPAEPAAPADIAERVAPLREVLAEYAAVRPEDVSLRAAAALLAFAADDAAGAADPLAALAAQARAADLGPDAEEPPAAETAGAWWLVGTAAEKHAATADDGRALTDAALAAADRLPDATWRIAMRVQAGQAALDREDPAAAEAHWTRLLGDLLDRDLEANDAPPGEAGAFFRSGGFQPPTASVASGTEDRRLRRRSAAGSRRYDAAAVAFVSAVADPDAGRVIPITSGPRARRALQLAKLAADRGLTALSLRAVRESLGGGAPLGGGSGGSGGAGMFGAAALASGDSGEGLDDGDIARILTELTAAWEQAEADPAAVADTLLEVVLPAARPTEAFVYPGSVRLDDESAAPTDAVRPLLDWAGRAGATDAVAERLETRSAAGPAGAAVDLLRVRLALQTGETGRVPELLAAIAENARRGGSPADGTLALHAALPALNMGVAPERAYEALLAGAEAAGGDDGVELNHLPRLAREALARGELEAGQRFFDSYLTQTRVRYSRYGGDYGTRQQRTALVRVVNELARGGAAVAALERLAELDRLPPLERSSSDEPNPHRLAPDLARGLAGLPADERYAALFSWTLPGDGAVRGMAGAVPADTPPAEFGRPADPARRLAAAADRPPAPLTGTVVALAAAALDAGETDDLAAALAAADAARAAEVARLAAEAEEQGGADDEAEAETEAKTFAEVAEEVVEVAELDGAVDMLEEATESAPAASAPPPPALGAVNAATLRLLIGRPVDLPAAFGQAAALREWAAERAKRAGSDDQQTAAAEQAVGANLLLAWAALGDAANRAAVLTELKTLEPWANDHAKAGGVWRAQILALRVEAEAATAAGDTALPPLGADHGVWRSAAPGSYATGPNDRPPWVLLLGTAHATGPARANLLMFRYPLAGTFGIEVAANNGNREESTPVYGGLIHEAFPWNHTYRGRDFNGTRYAERPAPWLPGGRDQQYRFDVSPAETVLRVGGRRIFADPAPPAGSPFLGLAVTDGRRGWFRAVRIDGDPTIPPAVDLFAGDRLDGWFGPTGNGPPPRPELEVKYNGSPPGWSVAGGVLRSAPVAGRIVHHRPLFDGDRIAFAFRTAGTTATVLPSLDRVGFVLDPAGVRLRFLPVQAPQGRFDEDAGLSPTQTVPAPGALGPVPLRPDDWNDALLEANAGRLTLSVNGTPVLERDLSAGAGTAAGAAHADRLFGFVTAPGRRAEVRGVTLSGDWPAELPEAWKANLLRVPALLDEAAADPLAAGEPDAAPETRAAAAAAARRAVALIGHGSVTHATWDLLVAAAALPPEERLRLLAEQVLPLPADPHWRSDYAFSPADPPPGVDLPGVENPATGARVPTGGRLVSPTLALVAAAAEQGRLGDLRAAAERLPAGHDIAQAAKSALLAAIGAEDGGPIEPHVAFLEGYVGPMTKEAEVWRPRPALIAARALADAALADPGNQAARDGARRLAALYRDRFQNNFGGPWSVPKRQARLILGELRGDGAEPDPAASPWVVAPDAALIRRADGFPRAIWVAGDEGEVRHWGGGERDRLFAVRPRVPAGDGTLTVTATPTVGWFGSVRVLAGGLGAQPHPKGDQADVRSLAGSLATVPLGRKVEGPTYDLTQEVSATRFRALFGDQTVWGASLDRGPFGPPLPFLALQARGDHGGSVRDLATTGEMAVPETVDLLPAAANRIPDWWLDAYGDENADRTTAGWAWTNDGLNAPRQEDAPDAETLLTFPRPLAAATETVRFEFFQLPWKDAPDRAGVHAALGRLAFVLTDGGVRIHRITDGPAGRLGLAADNLSDEPEHRRGPDRLDLAPDEWHAVTLTVSGDVVTLELDGTLIYERPLDPANRRTFGLFRWSGDRPVRVRNVTLSGAWE